MRTHPLLITDDARPEADHRFEALQRWRDVAAEPCSPGRCASGFDTALVEQAKGALMLRFGVDSYQALAVLVRWARVARTPVRTIAHALLHGICEGSSQTEIRQRPLIRWLEAQLRAGDPDRTPLPMTRVWSRTGT